MTHVIYYAFVLILSGIRDENNRTYNPKIVRIGLKAHHSVQAVSMDYLVSNLMHTVLNFIYSVVSSDNDYKW